MKKLIKLLSLIMALTLFCTLFACEDASDTGDGGEATPPPVHIHVYIISKYDENWHWAECSCGEKVGNQEHEFFARKCECGYFKDTSVGNGGGNSDFGGESAPPHEHEYVDGKCVVCEQIKPIQSDGLEFRLINNDTEYEVLDNGCKDKQVIIPAMHEGLPVTRCLFSYVSIMRSIELPATITDLGTIPFDMCKNLREINVAEDNPVYKSIDGNLYSKDGKTLIRYAVGKIDTTFTIPEHVTSLYTFAFQYGDSLLKVVIPENVTNLGSSVFWMCTALTNVQISENVKILGGGTFAYCKSLRTVKLPANLEVIESSAFSECTALSVIDVPDSVESIGVQAFENCKSLKKIELPSNIRYIGYGAFEDCASLESANIPAQVQEVYFDTFYNCYSLKSVEIPNDSQLTKIESNAFNGCKLLESIHIPSEVKHIGTCAFKNCESLTEIVIPEKVGGRFEIANFGFGERVFENCTSLTKVVFNESKIIWGNITQNLDLFIGSSVTEVICADGTVKIN